MPAVTATHPKLLLLLATLLAGAPGWAGAQGIGTEAWIAVPDQRGVQVVHIECGANFIDPREIVVQPGVPVELSVRTTGEGEEFVSGLAENLRVDKQPKKQRFSPAARGKHTMLCKKPGQRDAEVSPRRKGVLHVGHDHRK